MNGDLFLSCTLGALLMDGVVAPDIKAIKRALDALKRASECMGALPAPTPVKPVILNVAPVDPKDNA